MRPRAPKSRDASTRWSRASQTRRQNEEGADARTCFGFVDCRRFPCGGGASPNELQDLRRSAEGLHEELCRPGLRDRIQNLHEGMQEIAAIAALAALQNSPCSRPEKMCTGPRSAL